MKKSKDSHSRNNGFDEWGGYMEAKKFKLAEQFSLEAAKDGTKVDDLFKGIAIFVNGYTDPSSEELKNLMIKHGGMYHYYFSTSKTTHIIASNLPDSKVKQIKSLKVVKPSWIVESIAVGKLLDYRNYLLYTNKSKTQPELCFELKNLREQNEDLASSENTNESVVKLNPSTKNDHISTSEDRANVPQNASDEKFLNEFYNNSRLHLISTMGARFKEFINELRACRDKHTFPGRVKLKEAKKITQSAPEFSLPAVSYKKSTIIMHIDMDCFFVSVGIRDKPELQNVPVAVTHAKGNRGKHNQGSNPEQELLAYKNKLEKAGKADWITDSRWSSLISKTDSMSEIASCSYRAREFGVKNGMFLGEALKICPNLKTIPYDFEKYKEVSYILYETVAGYTLDIEAMSCDEMFVDCSEILSDVDLSPLDFATILRKEIEEKTKCPCSTGFGNNRLLARLATKKAKPNGQFYLEPEAIEEFMKSIKVRDLPGVGRSTSHKLYNMGVTNCQELKDLPLIKLQAEFGQKLGETLYNNARGIDQKGLVFDKVRKSVSAEVNYGIRFQNDTERDFFLKQLSEEVSSRLSEVKMKGRCLSLKIMARAKDAPEETAKFMGHGVCDNITKSITLPYPVDDPCIIFREVSSILRNIQVKAKDLRGLGIQISRLEKNLSNNVGLRKFLNKKTNSVKNIISTEFEQNEELSVEQHLNEGRFQKPGPSGMQNSCIYLSSKNKLSSDFSENHKLIDPTFLEALPHDLKLEVLRNIEHHINPNEPSNLEEKNKCSNSDTIKCTSPDKNSNYSTPQKKEDSVVDKSSNEENGSYVSPKEMLSMMKQWIDTEAVPQSCDVSLFSDYLQQMVSSHQIEDLHIILKSFQRKISNTTKLITWKDTYSTIVDKVQTQMVQTYGGKLMLRDIPV